MENKKNRGVNRKDRNKGRDQRNEQKTFKPDMSVWKIIEKTQREWRKKHPEDDFIDLDAPCLTPSKEIKMRTAMYAELSIVEAFNKAYNTNIEDREDLNIVPSDARIGDIIHVTIKSITKESVQFHCNELKQVIETRNNLYRFDRFKKFLPTETLRAIVTDVNSERVMVDLFKPMVDDFLAPIVANPWIQNKLGVCETITVKDLHMVRGGFKGRAVIPTISAWTGEDYEVDAFVPGSQVCLNIAEDFSIYEGATIETFIVSASTMPNGRLSVVCSAKKFLQHIGAKKMMAVYNMWCDDDDKIKEFSQNVFEAKVTGIINSSKQCGVFVEVPDLNVVGMCKIAADQLVNYPAGTAINVTFKTFDENLTYNDTIGQYEHNKPAFEIENGCIKTMNIKPVFEIA